MPRRADHATPPDRDGWEQVVPRQVAAEAGTPASLLECYVGTRIRLLPGASKALNADGEHRNHRRLAEVGRGPAPARSCGASWACCHRSARSGPWGAGRTSPGSQSNPDRPQPRARRARLRPTSARAGGPRPRCPRVVEPAAEAAFPLACAEGLRTGMLLERLTPDRDLVLLDHQVNHTLATGR